MSIDFFDEHCQSKTDQPRFGLCDEPPPSNTPAYIDIDVSNGKTKWIAIVENANKMEVIFTAIDKCIEIKESDGKRCDGMLTYEDCIIFVELKERSYTNRIWIDDAEQQIENTINIFSKNHDMTNYKSKKAYIANRKKPKFQYGHKETMQKFRNKTGFRLSIENTIKI